MLMSATPKVGLIGMTINDSTAVAIATAALLPVLVYHVRRAFAPMNSLFLNSTRASFLSDPLFSSGSDVPKPYQRFWRSFPVNLFTAFDSQNPTRLSGVLCA